MVLLTTLLFLEQIGKLNLHLRQLLEALEHRRKRRWRRHTRSPLRRVSEMLERSADTLRSNGCRGRCSHRFLYRGEVVLRAFLDLVDWAVVVPHHAHVFRMAGG